ncbi:MAG TPA: ABC transporter permease [Gemmatimonadaceae bacterium]
MSEFRTAFARLRRSPGFVLGATLSLALGMSLATAVFSVVNSILNTGLPFPEADRLVYVTQELPQLNQQMGYTTARMFQAIKDTATPALREVAAWSRSGVMMGPREEQTYVGAAWVTSAFHRTLRVRPLLGRTFDENDARLASPPVVISHSLWVARFASDSGIVGKEVAMSLSKHRVIGVMPEGFDFPFNVDVWLPLNEDSIAAEARDPTAHSNYLQAFGRLAPGATIQQASVEIGALYRRLYRNDPTFGVRYARVMTVGEYMVSLMREALQVWSAAAILVAILCAVNFATMSMARGMRRRDEIAVRAALGATRIDLARTLLVEAVLLSALGGAVAILFGYWIVGFASALFASGTLPVTPAMDWKTILESVSATMVVGFVFAAAPALELAKVDLRSALQGAAGAVTSNRRDLLGRRALVALQLSLALTGVAVVTALIQSDRRFQSNAYGFDADQLVVARVYGDSAASPVPADRMLERIQATPGVVDAASTGTTPSAIIWRDKEALDGRYYYMRATPSLFRTLGVHLLAGRVPSEEEVRAHGDLMMASESMAMQLAGSAQAAVGKRYRVKSLKQPIRWVTIVGVVPNYGGVWRYNMSAPLYQLETPQPGRFQSFVIRVSGDPNVRAREMRTLLAGMDPHLVVSDVRSLQSVIDEERGATRGRAIFLSAVAALALVLAVIGVYGLTAYTTELRLREFGIRIALGASTPRLARAVYGDLWWMSALAIGVGVLATGRLVSFLDELYRPMMMRTPLIVFPVVPTIVSAATLVVISLIGTAMPVRRILRMDVIRAVMSGG